MTSYPRYDPALGRAKLTDGESYICNSNLTLGSIQQCALIQRARRRFSAAERSTLQFAADLRRLNDAGAHKLAGVADFPTWAAGVFDGLSKANAKLLCWQGALLLILEGHGLIDLDDRKLRLGATAVRKLCSLLSHFNEDAILLVWHQMQRDKPDGKFVEADVKAAMDNSGFFILNRQQQQEGDEEERPDEVIVTLNNHADQEDLADAPAAREANVGRADVEAIVHLHQELVDPFDKLRRELVKLTDPDNQPYDVAAIRHHFNEAVDLLLDLGDLLADHEDEDAA